MTKNLILYRNVKIPLELGSKEYHDTRACEYVKKIYARQLKDSFGDADFFVYKKSVDARKSDKICFIYTVAVMPKNELSEQYISSRISGAFELVSASEPDFKNMGGKDFCEEKPVVVGFGPSGMFCAYALAKAGLKPVVIERGSCIEERTSKVNSYWQGGVLDRNCNVQFGEGGAGAFSDGKLLTRIGDPLTGFVLKTFYRHGAPKEIMYLSKPHVGTDLLFGVVRGIREEIKSLGGSIMFDSTVTGIKRDSSGRATAVTVNGSFDVECSALFLCIGHSARDTFSMLSDMDFHITPKAFSVGLRVEHLQSDISKALYGDYAEYEALERAQYTLSARNGDRGVYSFCMCPGGTVVASASDTDEIVTNGMSNFKRDGLNANSAIAVSVNTSDYGNTVEGAIDFQKKIEQAAFSLAGNDGTAPIQLLGDFLSDSKTIHEPKRIMPTYTGKTKLCQIESVFPQFISDSLKFGFGVFEKHIKGFSAADAVLTAPETRTSSPVRINRNEERLSISSANIYPCGEGAGYAGGITSAAVDGLKSAISYLNSKR